MLNQEEFLIQIQEQEDLTDKKEKEFAEGNAPDKFTGVAFVTLKNEKMKDRVIDESNFTWKERMVCASGYSPILYTDQATKK